MTQDDIIGLAKAYGFTGGFDAEGKILHDEVFVVAVTEAVERERAACAMTCIDLAHKWTRMGAWGQNTEYHECAEAIRARGKE